MKPLTLLILAIRLGLGAVFIVSGFQKLTAPAANFVAVIEAFEIIQGPLAQAVSYVLPWVELIGGVFFAFGLWTRLSMAALWLMNTAFIGILASALLRKLPIDQCGCFGKAVTFTPQQMLGLDILIWGLFLVFFLTHKRLGAPSLDRSLNG